MSLAKFGKRRGKRFETSWKCEVRVRPRPSSAVFSGNKQFSPRHLTLFTLRLAKNTVNDWLRNLSSILQKQIKLILICWHRFSRAKRRLQVFYPPQLSHNGFQIIFTVFTVSERRDMVSMSAVTFFDLRALKNKRWKRYLAMRLRKTANG